MCEQKYQLLHSVLDDPPLSVRGMSCNVYHKLNFSCYYLIIVIIKKLLLHIEMQTW